MDASSAELHGSEPRLAGSRRDQEVKRKRATWTALDQWRLAMKVQNKCIFEIIE